MLSLTLIGRVRLFFTVAVIAIARVIICLWLLVCLYTFPLAFKRLFYWRLIDLTFNVNANERMLKIYFWLFFWYFASCRWSFGLCQHITALFKIIIQFRIHFTCPEFIVLYHVLLTDRVSLLLLRSLKLHRANLAFIWWLILTATPPTFRYQIRDLIQTTHNSANLINLCFHWANFLPIFKYFIFELPDSFVQLPFHSLHDRVFTLCHLRCQYLIYLIVNQSRDPLGDHLHHLVKGRLYLVLHNHLDLWPQSVIMAERLHSMPFGGILDAVWRAANAFVHRRLVVEALHERHRSVCCAPAAASRARLAVTIIVISLVHYLDSLGSGLTTAESVQGRASSNGRTGEQPRRLNVQMSSLVNSRRFVH